MQPAGGSATRYRDFPELFWDAQPDALIDVSDPVTLARLLTRGRPEIIGQLVPQEVLREALPLLGLPQHVLVFWRAVLDVASVSVNEPSGAHDATRR